VFVCVRSAGQALGLGLDELEAAEAFNEQELLERMRTAVSCNPSQRMRQQQRRLSALSALPVDPAAEVSQEQLAAAGLGEDGVVTDSAYEEELENSMMRQISQEMEEVLQAIDAEQKRDAQAAEAAIIAVQQEGGLGAQYPRQAWGAAQDEQDEDQEYDGAQSDYQSDVHTSYTPYRDVWDAEDAEDQGGRAHLLAGLRCTGCWARLPLGSLHVH
jgi:hypothetical protein